MVNNTIMFVDDEPYVLESYKRIFKGYPYKLKLFSNPVEALDKIYEINPAIIITDQMMPEMKGTELLEKVRVRYPSVIRILITGMTSKVHIIDAVNKGEIFRYISKPWDQEELIMTVKNAVERYNILSEFNRYKNEKQVPDQKGVELFRQCSEEITACIEDMKIQQKAYLESAEKLAHTLKSVSEKMSDAPDH